MTPAPALTLHPQTAPYPGQNPYIMRSGTSPGCPAPRGTHHFPSGEGGTEAAGRGWDQAIASQVPGVRIASALAHPGVLSCSLLWDCPCRAPLGAAMS